MVLVKMIVQCKHSILLLFPIPYSLLWNSIGYEGAKAIGEALRTNTVLHTLECDAYSGGGGWCGRTEWVWDGSGLKAVGGIVGVMDMGNGFGEGDYAIQSLCFLLFSIPYSLWNNSIRDEGAKIIASALVTNTVLNTL